MSEDPREEAAPEEALSPLEQEVIAAIQRSGQLQQDELNFVVRRIRTTIRTIELGRQIGRPLTRKERGQVFRRLQDGQSLEKVQEWLRSKPVRPTDQ